MAIDTVDDTRDTPQTALGNQGLEEFLELEAKINRVAEALRESRAERDHSASTLLPLQAAHEKLQHAYAQAERELVSLRKERNEIRQRVARLVAQLEAASS